jgi:hypothetical protein
MLQTFADDSPYPTGTVRFWLDPSVLPTEFLGDEAIPSEVLDLHTRGGPWIEKLAPTIVTLAAVVVGSALVGPEFALTAFAIYGAITGFADIVSRLAAGTFEFDLQTGLDILGIVGGLTAGISPILSVVRGVGEVAWLGTLAKTAGVLQLGVMAGTHLKQIVKAVQSGDQNEIMEAVMSAIVDGAFVVVTHAQSKAGQTEARARTVDDPVFASVQGGYLLDPGQMVPPAAAAPVEPAQPRWRQNKRREKPTNSGPAACRKRGFLRARFPPRPLGRPLRAADTRARAASLASQRRKKHSRRTTKRWRGPVAARSASTGIRPRLTASMPWWWETSIASSRRRTANGSPRSTRIPTRRTC